MEIPEARTRWSNLGIRTGEGSSHTELEHFGVCGSWVPLVLIYFQGSALSVPSRNNLLLHQGWAPSHPSLLPLLPVLQLKQWGAWRGYTGIHKSLWLV